MEAITVEVAVSALSYVMCFEMHELKKRRLKYIHLRLFRYLTTSLTFSSLEYRSCLFDMQHTWCAATQNNKIIVCNTFSTNRIISVQIQYFLYHLKEYT